MPRIKLRPIEEVRWDLKRILDRGPKVVSLHIETPLAKEVKSMVAGCFELLMAELLSHKLRLGDITYDELINPPCIKWNGKVFNETPVMASTGLPDIEAYPNRDEALIVDVSLSSRKEVLIAELKRLRTHNPSLCVTKIKRIFVAPHISVKVNNNIKLVEIGSSVKGKTMREPKLSYYRVIEKRIHSVISNSPLNYDY